MELGECKLCGTLLDDRNLTERQKETYEVMGMCPDCARKTNKALRDSNPYQGAVDK